MLSIDIETASPRDLAKCGVYAYAEDFALLLFGYSLNNSPVKCVDVAHGEEIPPDILDMLTDENVIKSAFNVNFERVCLSAYLRQYYPERMQGQQFLSPRGWHCSMVWSASLGLPRTLAEVAEQLHLDCQKMAEGKELIRRFSTEGRENVENWELFKKYNIRDVEVEMAITKKLARFPHPNWEEFYLDQEINDRGVRIDRELVKNAIKADTQNREVTMARMQELTGLGNPNSVVQLKEWLANQGIVVASLDKKTVGQLLEGELSRDVREVLELRLNSAKSSVKKYQAIEGAMCTDGRVRGMFRYYGASRSGRWCLARGTPVLVCDASGAIYEKPIEKVSTRDLVFDGEDWVAHDGVVYSGDKEVITWDGITATPEHKVYIDADTAMTLSEARERGVELWKGHIRSIE